MLCDMYLQYIKTSSQAIYEITNLLINFDYSLASQFDFNYKQLSNKYKYIPFI